MIPTNADLDLMTLNMNFVMETAKSINDMFAKWRAMQEATSEPGEEGQNRIGFDRYAIPARAISKRVSDFC